MLIDLPPVPAYHATQKPASHFEQVLPQGMQQVDFSKIIAPTILRSPWYGGREATLNEKIDHMFRTIYLGAGGLFAREKIPDPKTHLHEFWQWLVHTVFPGDTFMAVTARMRRSEEDKAIPVHPETRTIDPRQFMPNIVFSDREKSFPVSADFDGDGNVNNNAFTYQHGRFSGNQQPTFYVHSVKKGQYTVLIYNLYFVDNLYSNYHNHDWQPFEIYMRQNERGQWQQEFLMTHWHHGVHMERWGNLKLDTRGRPFIKVEGGAHAIWPFTRNQSIPQNNGWTMRHDGLFQKRHNGHSVQAKLRFISPDSNFIETQKPVQLPGGYTPLTYPFYLKDELILGFIPTANRPDVEPGPAGRSHNRYHNPLHPSSFFKEIPLK